MKKIIIKDEQGQTVILKGKQANYAVKLLSVLSQGKVNINDLIDLANINGDKISPNPPKILINTMKLNNPNFSRVYNVMNYSKEGLQLINIAELFIESALIVLNKPAGDPKEPAIDPTINFAYFTMNFQHDFIKKCWSDDSLLSDHLQSKFNSKAENGVINAGGFMSFYMELTDENKKKLNEWVMANYNYRFS